ncbi:DUF2782 domain-containing protein [Bacterioplanoides sp. SCSIO 12839]|uniref:DUF2782 domain-containing protein n=1 Tax=Bacterioplanoides sp. SCSIO 12839 TaxID=2829569 RepID=UPI002104BD17|nr:DUF2782 domain-containing protein [Bacterioplanoides sp. SCSIO 12839]UTW48216.1 DUF2782 domain-containing protein [Bacterioplanoides sp. SCSIO 12839]
MAFKKTLAVTLISVVGLFTSLAQAEDPSGETVTIRNDGDNTYYEFRVNGEISEIKVVPKIGKPYYLIPTHDEDGDFMRKDDPEMRVPSWVIFRW